MRRMSAHILAVMTVLLCLASCREGGRIIPRSEMTRIYVDMFLADAWFNTQDMEVRRRIDSTSFYEPIFNAHGYTTQDYVESNNHYLTDPERYSLILKKAHDILDEGMKSAQKELEEYQAVLARKSKVYPADRIFQLYDTICLQPSYTDRVDMQVDTAGRFYPRRVLGDTLFFGPQIIVRADTALVEKDTLAVEGPVADD